MFRTKNWCTREYRLGTNEYVHSAFKQTKKVPRSFIWKVPFREIFKTVLYCIGMLFQCLYILSLSMVLLVRWTCRSKQKGMRQDKYQYHLYKLWVLINIRKRCAKNLNGDWNMKYHNLKILYLPIEPKH